MRTFNPLALMEDDDVRKKAAFKILQALSGFNYRDVKFILDLVSDSIDFHSIFTFEANTVDYKSAQSSACTVAQDHQSKKNVPAKMQKQNSFKIDFTDGGYISYDASISKLDIYCPGEISINGKLLRLQEEKLNVSN